MNPSKFFVIIDLTFNLDLSLAKYIFRAESKLAPSQWETSLQSNAVSHWLGETAQHINTFKCQPRIYGPSLVITMSTDELAPDGLVQEQIHSLQWRHNERYSVTNHRCLDCLLNRLFRRGSKKIWKLRVSGLCEGNPPVTGGFLSQSASDAESVSIWWRHHVPAI